MLRDEAVSLVRQGLGFRSDLSTQIITQMKLEQIKLEERSTLPWFLLSEIATASTTIGEPRLPVPNNFLMEYEEGTLWLYDSSEAEGKRWKEIIKTRLDELVTDAQDEPEYYALSGDYFWLSPVPDAAYTMKMKFYKKAEVLDSNIENGWLKHAPDLMISITGLHMAEDLENDKAAAKFQQRLIIAEDSLMRKIEARQHANQRYVMGGRD